MVPTLKLTWARALYAPMGMLTLVNPIQNPPQALSLILEHLQYWPPPPTLSINSVVSLLTIKHLAEVFPYPFDASIATAITMVSRTTI